MPMSGSLPRLLATRFPKPKHASMGNAMAFAHLRACIPTLLYPTLPA